MSKTVWFNVISLTIAILGVVAESPLVMENPKVVAGIMAGIAALNIALRFVSERAIYFSKG